MKRLLDCSQNCYIWTISSQAGRYQFEERCKASSIGIIMYLFQSVWVAITRFHRVGGRNLLLPDLGAEVQSASLVTDFSYSHMEEGTRECSLFPFTSTTTLLPVMKAQPSGPNHPPKVPPTSKSTFWSQDFNI